MSKKLFRKNLRFLFSFLLRILTLIFNGIIMLFQIIGSFFMVAIDFIAVGLTYLCYYLFSNLDYGSLKVSIHSGIVLLFVLFVCLLTILVWIELFKIGFKKK